MNRSLEFERLWNELERPGRPEAETLPPPPELAGAVATAAALRRQGQALPTMDLDAAWAGIVARLDGDALSSAVTGSEVRGTRDGRIAPLIPLRSRIRLAPRLAAAAVAALVALAVVSLRADPGSAFYPVRLTFESAALALSPNDGSIHLRIADARLDDLLVSLRKGPVKAAPGLARSLVVNRSAAGRGGADVTDLDLRVALEVPPALRVTPSSIASAVRTILGDLLPEEPTPGQSAPPPGESPTPRGRPSAGPGDGGNGHGSGDRKGDGGQERGEDSHGGSGSGDGEHQKDAGSDSSQGSESHGSGKGSNEQTRSQDGSGLSSRDESGPGSGN